MSGIGARMTLLAAALALGLAPAGPVRAEPQIASVSEPSVRLQAGGRPVTLTLQGSDLDQLQSAAVLLGTQPAPGLTAQLGPAAKTARTLTLTALATAKPGRDYKLQLTGGKAPLTPAVSLEVTAPAPAPVAKVEAPKPEAPKPAGSPPAPPARLEPPPAPAAPKAAPPVAIARAPAVVPAPPREPRVTSVSPQAVRLQAGGPPALLTLVGEDLDRLQSAAVLRGTQAAAGVSAALGPSTKGARTLTLTAQRSALPGRDYRVQASGGRQPILLAASVEVYWPVTLARPLAVVPAAPVLIRVERTADGYALVGRGFGTDRSRLQVFEGSTQVGTLASLADARIVVRSRPSGVVQHRVVVGGLPSATVVFTHPTAPGVVGSVGVSSSELAKILQSPRVRALPSGAPTTPAPLATPAPPALRPGTAGPGAGSPGAGGATGAGPGVTSGLAGPTGPGGAAATTPSTAPAPRAEARRDAAFRPRSQTTGELTMSGIGR